MTRLFRQDWHPPDHVSFFSKVTPERLAAQDQARFQQLKLFDVVRGLYNVLAQSNPLAVIEFFLVNATSVLVVSPLPGAL